MWNFFDRLKGDKVVWFITLVLTLISIVCIFSSTSRLLRGDQTRLDIVGTQLLVVGLGLLIIFLLTLVNDTKYLRFLSMFGFPLTVLLTMMVICKANFGIITTPEINHARRIIQIGGFQLHIFEVVKVAMVMYLSWAMDAIRKDSVIWPKDERLNKKEYKKLVYIYIPFIATLLLVLPGSNSAALLIGLIMFITILLGGDNFKSMFLLGMAGIAAIGFCVGIYYISDKKLCTRIGTGISRLFENEDYEKKVIESRVGSKEYYEALDEIRQPYSAKIAIKEGGPLGKGPGQSTQRYVVPDMAEDYMFSFIIEEYGIFGVLVVLILYVGLLARGSLIAKHCEEDYFAKLAVSGLVLLITGQAFLHMLVNADIGPMTGQTLPLISHGNTAFICFSIAFGIILSISRISERTMAIEEQEKMDKLSEEMNEDNDEVR